MRALFCLPQVENTFMGKDKRGSDPKRGFLRIQVVIAGMNVSVLGRRGIGEGGWRCSGMQLWLYVSVLEKFQQE